MTLLPKCLVDDDEQVVLIHVVKTRILDRMTYATRSALADGPSPPNRAQHQAWQAQQGRC
jgi:hypothetical protein